MLRHEVWILLLVNDLHTFKFENFLIQHIIENYLFILLKALPPVCMKYTAQDES